MRFAVLLCSLLLAPMAYADSIGVFSVTSGEVRVLRAQNYLAAAPGVEILREDIVETAKESAAQLDMEDGSSLKLGPDTRMVLSDYRLDSKKNVVSASLDVLSGWLRFAVAKLKPTGNYKFNTPVIVVGIRGTEGTIEADNEKGGMHLSEGVVDVTPFGKDSTGLPPLRVNAGEFVQRSFGQPLTKLPQPPTAFRDRLPPVMQQKLVRRVDELKQRNVTPKIIRPVTLEDARHLIEKHPHMNEKLRERFKPLGVSGPLAPGKEPKGKEDQKDAQKEQPRGGFGGQVLRERQLKTGEPSDPKEVAEALRKRFQTQQGLPPAATTQRSLGTLQQKPVDGPSPVGTLQPTETPKLPLEKTRMPGVTPSLIVPAGTPQTTPAVKPQEETKESDDKSKMLLRTPVTTVPLRTVPLER